MHKYRYYFQARGIVPDREEQSTDIFKVIHKVAPGVICSA